MVDGDVGQSARVLDRHVEFLEVWNLVKVLEVCVGVGHCLNRGH